MGIFEWTGKHGEILNVSPYIWLYLVATLVITSVTLGTWYLWVVRRGHGNDIEAQRGEPSEKATLSSRQTNFTGTT
jgi:hypothetical protein